mmetsp:Transcript_43016/g.124399  ORF Transcript_43016/g.124399 Transcript_43016/m.124399 type:complete len:262 (+) Transcript_43016:279-1064(+)
MPAAEAWRDGHRPGPRCLLRSSLGGTMRDRGLRHHGRATGGRSPPPHPRGPRIGCATRSGRGSPGRRTRRAQREPQGTLATTALASMLCQRRCPSKERGMGTAGTPKPYSPRYAGPPQRVRSVARATRCRIGHPVCSTGFDPRRESAAPPSAAHDPQRARSPPESCAPNPRRLPESATPRSCARGCSHRVERASSWPRLRRSPARHPSHVQTARPSGGMSRRARTTDVERGHRKRQQPRPSHWPELSSKPCRATNSFSPSM